MGELHTKLKYQLSGVDPESYFDLHTVPSGYQQKIEGNCGYLAQYNQTYSGWVGRDSHGQLPT